MQMCKYSSCSAIDAASKARIVCILSALVLSVGMLRAADAEKPSPAERLVGEWQGYIENRGEVTFKTSYRYRLSPDGSWTIHDDSAGSDERQGWFKAEAGTLFLQPRAAAEKNQNAAIAAAIVSDVRFEIPNSLLPHRKLFYSRLSASDAMTLEAATGKWQLKQKLFDSGEIRKAPYIVEFKDDFTYQVTQDGKTLPPEWSAGSFEIENGFLKLKNTFREAGFWRNPVFFRKDGRLIYNDGDLCLWGEPAEGRSSGRID